MNDFTRRATQYWVDDYGFTPKPGDIKKMLAVFGEDPTFKSLSDENKTMFLHDVFIIRRVDEMFKELAGQSQEDPGPFRSALAKLGKVFEEEDTIGHITAVGHLISEKLDISIERAFAEIVRFDALANLLLAASAAVSARPKLRDERATRSRRQRAVAKMAHESLDRVGVRTGGRGSVGRVLGALIAKYASGEVLERDALARRRERDLRQFRDKIS
jgi:hypothetical protein